MTTNDLLATTDSPDFACNPYPTLLTSSFFGHVVFEICAAADVDVREISIHGTCGKSAQPKAKYVIRSGDMDITSTRYVVRPALRQRGFTKVSWKMSYCGVRPNDTLYITHKYYLSFE